MGRSFSRKQARRPAFQNQFIIGLSGEKQEMLLSGVPAISFLFISLAEGS
jgi:hypothetical protein